jgi:hypothetical protein
MKVCLGLVDPTKTVVIGNDLAEKLELALTSFLRDNADIFAWTPWDMPGVPRELAEHSLDVSKTAKRQAEAAPLCEGSQGGH